MQNLLTHLDTPPLHSLLSNLMTFRDKGPLVKPAIQQHKVSTISRQTNKQLLDPNP